MHGVWSSITELETNVWRVHGVWFEGRLGSSLIVLRFGTTDAGSSLTVRGHHYGSALLTLATVT
jgi:hypothetical protein